MYTIGLQWLYPSNVLVLSYQGRSQLFETGTKLVMTDMSVCLSVHKVKELLSPGYFEIRFEIISEAMFWPKCY